MTVRRARDWDRRLDDWIAARRAMAFEWGVQDCCRFACGGLAAQGLPDPMAPVRAYTTARGAAAAIRRHGGTLEIAADRLVRAAGLVPVAPGFAQRGDLVLADVDTGDGVEPALGLVGLAGTHAWLPGATGLLSLPLGACRMAWGVA